MERLGGDWVGDAIVGRAQVAADEDVQAARRAAAPGATPAPALPANEEEEIIRRKVDTVLVDAVQKYEAFGKEASVYFERRVRLLSVIVAIFVAFALHVDAVDIFKTFLRDPAAREAMLKRKDDVMKAAESVFEGT